jgi:hypothetical protein
MLRCGRFLEDEEALFRDAGVSLSMARLGSGAACIVSQSGDDGDEDNCAACMDDVPVSQLVSLLCGHSFCRKCWAEHLAVAVARGIACLYDTRCLSFPDCKQVRCAATSMSVLFSFDCFCF